MRAVHCAIDTSLNFTQANKLIRELKPATLILPECYTQPPVTHPNRTELIIEQVVYSSIKFISYWMLFPFITNILNFFFYRHQIEKC